MRQRRIVAAVAADVVVVVVVVVVVERKEEKWWRREEREREFFQGVCPGEEGRKSEFFTKNVTAPTRQGISGPSSG